TTSSRGVSMTSRGGVQAAGSRSVGVVWAAPTRAGFQYSSKSRFNSLWSACKGAENSRRHCDDRDMENLPEASLGKPNQTKPNQTGPARSGAGTRRIGVLPSGLDLDPSRLGALGLGEHQAEHAVPQLGRDPAPLHLIAEDEGAEEVAD